jgi:hypothetical protein
MRRMMKGLLGLAVLAVLLGAPHRAWSQTTTTAAPTTTTVASTTTTAAPTTTTTTLPAFGWTVVLPTNCTGAGAPVACCVSATPAANAGKCNVRMNMGHLFEYLTTFNPNGGTYATGGTLLTAAQRGRIGLNQIIGYVCSPSVNGRLPVLITTAGSPGTLRIKLFNSGGTETSNGTALVSGTEAFTCLLFGY